MLEVAAKPSISAATLLQVSKIQYLAQSQQGVQFINWAKESSLYPGSSLFFFSWDFPFSAEETGIFFFPNATSSKYFKKQQTI